jgi:hypothetical protein
MGYFRSSEFALKQIVAGETGLVSDAAHVEMFCGIAWRSIDEKSPLRSKPLNERNRLFSSTISLSRFPTFGIVTPPLEFPINRHTEWSARSAGQYAVIATETVSHASY